MARKKYEIGTLLFINGEDINKVELFGFGKVIEPFTTHCVIEMYGGTDQFTVHKGFLIQGHDNILKALITYAEQNNAISVPIPMVYLMYYRDILKLLLSVINNDSYHDENNCPLIKTPEHMPCPACIERGNLKRTVQFFYENLG